MKLNKNIMEILHRKCTDYYFDMEQFLKELIAIPSVMGKSKINMPYGENSAKVLDVFLKKAAELGFKTKNIDNYAGTIDIGEGKPELGILCHLDVVDAGIGWNHPPFELTKSDGKLYGRGTTDDKGPAVSVLYGLKAAEETGLIKKPVRFIVGCNEENGSDDLEYYCKKEALPEKLYTPDGQYPVINIEKGMIRGKFSKKLAENSPKKYILKIHGGYTVNAVPSEAFAEICGFSEDEINIGNDFLYEDLKDSIKIISKGVSAHASTPENGKNALTKLIKFLSHLDFDNQISDTLKSLFEIFPYGETNGEHAGVKCSDDKSGALTLVLSVLEFDGTNFEGIFDIRFPVSFKSDEINSKIQKTLQSHGFDYECILASEPHYVDENSDFVQSLLKVYENLTGEKGKCIAIGGGTYVHNTPGGVAFGAEMPGKEYNIHCADEYTVPEEMILNAEMTANAVIEICG